MSIHYVDAFMRAALEEAELALVEGEVPVGCVLVRTDANEAAYKKLAMESVGAAATSASPQTTSPSSGDPLLESCISARGRNQTNLQRHALAHAEFIAAQQLIDGAAQVGDTSAGKKRSDTGDGGGEGAGGGGLAGDKTEKSVASSPAALPLSGLSEYVLYVTVEPCVMCGAMLLYNRIAHVFFGCRNPRFGGNGTVLALHTPLQEKSLPHDLLPPDQPAEKESPLVHAGTCSSYSTYESQIVSGGGWWPGYVSEGGHAEAEAIRLLQCFYERENPNAPGHKRRRKA
ncbi:hypothetical protein JKF63_07635 [Porcisia hertigi]|uniref:CMP/dCMP-type deaminase domain-containing protein n=1 Tax=Porcisia hertigi TaxID=2761500 RepID=A0A836LGP2_9TRYP|nr:hypothetical protein JKF63_07635 [Porcisia hertigi]